jgi:hypothetical protein
MGYRTPNIDRIAKDGMIFTDHYAEQSCTAGRSSFITGQGILRTGLSKVGIPRSAVGLQARDATLAELLKTLAYGCVETHKEGNAVVHGLPIRPIHSHKLTGVRSGEFGVRLNLRKILSFFQEIVLKFKLAVCAKFRPLASHGTLWRYSKTAHRCDPRKRGRSGDRNRARRRVFSFQKVF